MPHKTNDMKRINVLILLWCCCLLSTVAEPIDKSKALTAAQSFMASKRTATGKPRYAPGKLPTMTLAGEVKGLYVFNVQNNGGFVIVSNDDATIPVLGFSDSGNIDLNNMPDNMKAWLQGYADEIAWYQQHGVSTTNASRKAKVGSHSTDAIGPLLSTTWNQNSPYNGYCPNGFATGCVATAMAQVMYYTETKAGNDITTTTNEIPAYITRSYGIQMNAIQAGTPISWQDMINNYANGYTETQAEAVARLMSLCGLSLKMDYGPSSSAYTQDIPQALQDYFGYEETATCLSRSWYSYANWTDMIYNELQQGRAVVYAGISVDNGHSFVCDGYKYVDDTDYFHINWGWGGLSDEYFVLSVLDPDNQGIGGSASNSAYNSGQLAVVGIQKIGGEGTVLDIRKNDFRLTFNSITASHPKIALGESVDITINVTNESHDAYDGELCLVVNNSLGKGQMFLIPPGETKDCTINFTPTAVGDYTIGVTYPSPEPDYVGNYPSGNVNFYTNMTVVDQTPTDLTATDITSETAAISWTNVGEATAWNVNLFQLNLTQEDFNGTSSSDWQSVNFGSTGGFEHVETGGIDNSPCFRSPSYIDGQDLNPMVGLCTPEFDLGGLMAFCVWGTGEKEKFQVMACFDGQSFIPISEEFEAPATPQQFTLDLSNYKGLSALLAIVHMNSGGHTSESYLYIDNFSMLQPVGATSMVGSSDNSYRLTSLKKETFYQVKVQSVIHDGGKWSVPVIFKTTDNKLTLADDDSSLETKNASLIAIWENVTADVTLAGRTLYKDGKWNTICLPFEVTTLASSPLAGADVRKLSSASLVDGTMTLNFTEAGEIKRLIAGTPYIIKWDSGDNIVDPVFTNVYIEKTTHDFTSDDAKVQFKGTYTPITFAAANQDILYVGGDNKLYYPLADVTINAQRAYFQLSEANAAKNIVMNFDNTTEVKEVIEVKEVKDNSWYTLDGRKVSNGKLSNGQLPKGVYINGGQKVVIK